MDAHDLDELARRAARLQHEGRVASTQDAIRAVGGGPALSAAQVRRHLAAMTDAEFGQSEANAMRARMFDPVIEIMHAVNDHLERFTDRYLTARGTRLAGRAAGGSLDGDPIMHLRVLADISDAELAQVVVDAGAREPAFETVKSRHGRLQKIRTDHGGIFLHLLICPPGQVPRDQSQDLVRGHGVALLDVDGVMALRASLAGE